MVDKILDAIYQAYLEEEFKEQLGKSSAFKFEDSMSYLSYLCNSDIRIIIGTKKGNSVLKEEHLIFNIIGNAVTHGEEAGLKNGFLIRMLFAGQVNGKPINFMGL